MSNGRIHVLVHIWVGRYVVTRAIGFGASGRLHSRRDEQARELAPELGGQVPGIEFPVGCQQVPLMDT